MVWNLDTGRLYFSGKVRAAREAFAECFRRTFGVTPVPLIPFLAAEHVGLSDGAVQAVRGVEPSSLVAGATPEHDARTEPRQREPIATPALIEVEHEKELFE